MALDKFDLASMRLCVRGCRHYYAKPEDRYCGHCGMVLPSLQIEGDGEVAVDATAENQVSVQCWNSGITDVGLKILGSEDPEMVVLEGTPDLVLRPFERRQTLSFTVNSSIFNATDKKICRIPFESSDPRHPTGDFVFAYAEPGELSVRTTTLRLNDIARAFNDGEPSSKTPFVVHVENTGGTRLRLTIQPRTQDVPIHVDFEGGEDYWVGAYQSVDVKFVAWSLSNEDGPRDDFFELIVENGDEDAPKSVVIRLEAELYRKPHPQVTEVEFGSLLPRQIRLGTAYLFNHGSREFCVVGSRSSSPHVRVVTSLESHLPITSTPNGIPLEIAFSTQFTDEPVRINEGITRLRGLIHLYTDIPEHKEIRLNWSAELFIPERTNGTYAIDFGTVNSCVAFHDDHTGESKLIRDDNGNETIPSLLLFRAEGVFVNGQSALEHLSDAKPENVVHSVKRCLLGPPRQIFGVTYSPIELASMLIEQLLLAAVEQYRILPRELAVSIPANFWGPRRDAVIKACKDGWRLSDLNPVVIEEPTAAAMYYIWKNRDEFLNRSDDTNILVFDFGGGTLDISIVNVGLNKSGGREMGASIARGSNNLGGIDIDQALLRAMADAALEMEPEFGHTGIYTHKSEFEREYSNKGSFGRFLRERIDWINRARSTKEKLSDPDVIAVPFVLDALYDQNGGRIITESGDPASFDYSTTKDEFEEIIRFKLDQARRLLLSTLELSELDPSDIDIVLMTGQSCRIPAIPDMISDLFPLAEKPELPLKECVVSGTATAAYLLSRQTGTNENDELVVRPLDRTCYRYGYLRPADGSLSKRFTSVIEFGVPMGEAEGTFTFELKDASKSTTVEIAQHAGKDDVIRNGLDSDITLLEHVRINDYARDSGSAEFKMFFSKDNGNIVVTINGKPISSDSHGILDDKDIYL